MPGPPACRITVTAADRHRLKKRARGHKTPFRDRVRALIVLLAARGIPTAVIAKRAGSASTPLAPGAIASPPPA